MRKIKKTNIKNLDRAANMVLMNPNGFRKPPKNKKARRRNKTLVEKIDQDIKEYERKI